MPMRRSNLVVPLLALALVVGLRPLLHNVDSAPHDGGAPPPQQPRRSSRPVKTSNAPNAPPVAVPLHPSASHTLPFARETAREFLFCTK